MKLNHINLTVTDVLEASDFLVKYFGMRSMGAIRAWGSSPMTRTVGALC